MSGHPIEVEILVDVDLVTQVNREALQRAAQVAAQHRGFSTGEIGIRVCGDDEIRRVNIDHLDHDYATDVISFGYVADAPHVEGELVASVETAMRTAATLPGWSPENELLLYVVHGVLHICGMDDQDADSRADMRLAERAVLKRLGIGDCSRYGADEAETCETSWEKN